MDVLRKINYIFDRRQKIRLVILAVVIFGGALLELLGISIIMPFVSVISDSSLIHENRIYDTIYNLFNLKSDNQFILLFAIGLIVIYIVKNLYIIGMYDIQYRFTFNNQKRLVSRLVDCYMKQSYLFHVSKNVSELQRNVIDDVSMFFGAVLSTIQFFTEMMVCLLLMIYLFILDKSIMLGVGAVLIVFAYTYLKLFKRRTIFLGERNRETNAERNKWIRQGFEGIKEIKIVNREGFFQKKIDDCSEVFADAIRRSSLISSVPRPMFEAICVSALMAVVAIKIARGVDIRYFVPVLSAFAVAAFRLLPSFGRLTGCLNNITYNQAAVGAVYHDLKEAEELSKESAITGEIREVRLEKEIKVEHLYFRYPEVDKYVLEDACLTIPANKSIAFVGPSGAGKTTLADLILGLLTPEKGKISADGTDINENLNGWHKNLGYIPQTIYLIDDTIRNNILFGIPEAEADDEAVWRAIEDAQLKSFVDELEDGLDTMVGERGVRLSGGQRQRIGIARALYSNPAVLVLDEATSALDNDTEAAVMDAINSLRGKKTLIIIAHRLSTIENCDIKYEVNNGTVEKKQ